MNLAPVVFFVYNRPAHARRTIEALRNNPLAEKTDLIVYSDGAKCCESSIGVQAVREYVREIEGFNTVTVIERDTNWGLAANIIDGVTDVVNKYGKVIVMEDDIVTSPGYLRFMNNALQFYEQENKVWHISGWNYPIAIEGLEDVFFWRVMNCWGWATWVDRWKYFEKDPEQLLLKWTCEEKYRFDLDGSGVFWSQVEANAQGNINTWAVFWYATIFEYNGLCLNPALSYVDNIGHDGSGTNCGNSGPTLLAELNDRVEVKLTDRIVESVLAVDRIKSYYVSTRKPFLIRVVNKISRVVLKRNLFS